MKKIDRITKRYLQNSQHVVLLGVVKARWIYKDIIFRSSDFDNVENTIVYSHFKMAMLSTIVVLEKMLYRAKFWVCAYYRSEKYTQCYCMVYWMQRNGNAPTALLCRPTTQHTSRNPMTRLNLSTYYAFNVKDSELQIARVMGMTTINFTWPIN